VTATDAAAAGCSSRQLCCSGSAVHVDRFRNWGTWSLPVMQYISVSGLCTYQLLSLPSGLHFSSFPQKFWMLSPRYHACCMSSPSQCPLFRHYDNVRWNAHILELPIMYLSAHPSKFVIFSYQIFRQYSQTLPFCLFFLEVKLKFTLEQATKAQSGGRGIAILFLEHRR
jgi:hypothetical protein